MSKAFGEEIGGHPRNYRINMHCCAAAWPRSAGSVRATSRIAVQAVAALFTDHHSTETEIGAGDFFHQCDSADRSTSTTKTAAYGTSDLVPNWAEVPAVRLSESTIRECVRQRKIALGLTFRETFIPQSYAWGGEAQVDWYVPGSQDLMAPRWSPDGRYIAAQTFEGKKVLLFDFKRKKSSDLVNGSGARGRLAWSWDGKYLYFDATGDEAPGYYRIQLGQTRPELVVDLKDLKRYFGLLGTWSGITPDGSPLFVRDLSIDEIYALDLELP